MEQWEIDLRAKLEVELKDGWYRFGGEKEGDICFATGKGGAINFYVKWEKQLRAIRQ